MEMGLARMRLESLLQAYVEKSKLAEDHRCEEHRAVMLLQAAWRRKMVYKLLREWNLAARNIQRVYRGHLGRERFLYLARKRDKELRMHYFNKKATLIQRIFRGFYSRKTIHSYYARKEFLLDALVKGTHVKQEIEGIYEEQCSSRHRDAAKRARQEIDKFLEDNHCLLGTGAIKGIYYSHYLTVLGEPNLIEDKIKQARKLRSTVKEAKKHRGRLKQLHTDTPLWRSDCCITNGSVYVTRLDALREKEKKNRLMQLVDEDFRTTFRDRTNVFKGKTIRQESEYRPKTERDTLKWKRISDKPFVVRLPRRRMFSCGGT